MLLWMVLALLMVLSAAVGTAAYMAIKEYRRQRSNQLFFIEADAGTGTDRLESGGIANLSLPTSDINIYNKAKRQMYTQFAEAETQPFDLHGFDHFDNEGEGPSSADSSDESQGDDFNENHNGNAADEDTFKGAWQRSLPPDAKRTLRVLLVKRAMGSIPAVRQLQSELSAKARLNQMQLMSPVHWEKIQHYRDSLDEEIDFVRREAESIDQKWGTTDQVFREANMFYHHERLKAERAKEAAKLERQEKEANERQKEEKERQKRLAEKMMRGLLRQEDNEKQQTTKRTAAAKAKSGGAAAAKL